MFLFDKFRSSRQKYSTGNKCELRWKTFLPANPPFCAESTAIVDSDGNFYFGSHSGVFYSLNKNGEIRWSFFTKAKIYGSPLFSNENIIFASGDGWIYALKCISGEISWMFDLRKGYYDSFYQKIFQTLIHIPYTFNIKRKMQMDTKCWSSPLLIENKIYITAFGKGMYCFDINGNQLWSKDLGFPRYQLSGVVADESNNVYFVSRKGYLYSFTCEGQCNWVKKIGKYNVWGNPSYNDVNKEIIIPLSKGESCGLIACYETNKEGKLKKKIHLEAAIYGSVAIDSDRKNYYCADLKGFIYKINAITGEIIIKKKISQAVRALWTSPTIDSEGNIYITTKDIGYIKGRLIKMNNNLDEIWSFHLGQALSVPVILENGDVCAGSWDGNYYCIKTLNK